MKVTVDSKKCIAAGMCVAYAPEVFDQDDDSGIVVLLDDAPSSEQSENVRQAAEFCPAQLISFHD
ncbi:ferredoxin [Mycolicibacterium goodii]|uniref:ferredoxin n=1 Tax=Mycolicibacterium goodii TaxID=134601 RepID=UPI000C25DA7F|nr:ferredoxin [Mycolicibacterium goodii]PJK20438.1 ferredoxin [Mycolicibacterium goodii]